MNRVTNDMLDEAFISFQKHFPGRRFRLAYHQSFVQVAEVNADSSLSTRRFGDKYLTKREMYEALVFANHALEIKEKS